jgi:hypothetical protein
MGRAGGLGDSLGRETSHLFWVLSRAVRGHPEGIVPQLFWTGGRRPRYNVALQCNRWFPSLVLLYILMLV